MYINLSACCLKIKVSERYKATATRLCLSLSLYCLCGIMKMQSMLKFRISIALLATVWSICVAGCICSCISALVYVSKFLSVPRCYCICISLVLFLTIYLCICICISMCISVLYLYLYLSCFPVCLALPFGSVTYRFDFVYLSTLKKVKHMKIEWQILWHISHWALIVPIHCMVYTRMCTESQ